MKKLYVIASAIFFASGIDAQVHYSENFESGNASQWKKTDLDGDGRIFVVTNASTRYSGVGIRSIASYSWYNQPLTPDNLISSVPITLPSGQSNLFLKYDVASQANSDGAEHYAVYITTSNDAATVIASTPVFEETLPDAGSLMERTIDLSAYAGQTIYLSYRHYNTVNKYMLLIDNIKVETLASNDAKLTSGTLPSYILVNTPTDITYKIKNLGGNTITSVELNWNDGTDHIATVATNIPPGGIVDLVHPVKVNYSDLSPKNIVATVTKINNTDDANPADNSVNISTIVASQIVPKKVVLEEGTGTWCVWCPRGAVALHKVNEDYPNDQVSVAVHNGDPMTIAAYNSGAAFSGFPGMNVDRQLKGVDVSPTTIGNYVVTRKAMLTPVLLGGNYTIEGSTLTANASAQFFTNMTNANYRLAAIVIEDGVKGTTAGYNQYNAYAGGGNGPMGGYESLPNPVPASIMVYDHVGRELLGGYNGQEGSVPTTITDQQTVNYTFTYTIPSTYNPEKIHVALLLINQADKTVVNATQLQKGALAVSEASLAKTTSIYPNPAKSDFNLKFAKDGKYNVVIYDMSGKVAVNYGTISTSGKVANLPIKLLPGKYIVNISQEGISYSKELLVK